jgi:two-component system, sensor histidine kinase and response regulator
MATALGTVRNLRIARRRRRRTDGAAAHLAAIVESSADAIISTSLDGTIISWNRGAQRLYGYCEDEANGRPISLLLPDGEADELAWLLDHVGEDGHIDHFDTVRRHRDGSLVDVSLSVSPIRDLGGHIVGVSTIARDVTEQMRAERELAQARIDIDRFYDLALDVMAIANGDGYFIQVNRAFEEALGYSRQELMARPLLEFIHPDDLERTLELRASKNTAGSVGAFENRYRRKDGSYRWLLWSATATEDGLTYATARDVTHHKQMEKDLRESREQALAASRLKSEFVANMSHEIRTPLNGVVSMSELLMDSGLTAEQHEYAHVAMTSAEALMRVVDDILDFSKIEAGKLDIVEEEYSIEATLADVCEIVGVKAHAKGLKLTPTIAATVPDVVCGDSNRVRQVLLNLLTNAVKFTSEGEVVMRVARESCGDVGDVLRFEVSDTGIGIDESTRERLFQPFSQADPTTTRRYGGSGLGLCIAKQLVELMGGDIDVRSVPGDGSTFWFTLPCRPGTEVIANRSTRDLTGIRVLVVDDNVPRRQSLERQLAAWGMNPASAPDGGSAIEVLDTAAAAGTPFEVMLIDMQIPGMDGLELARRTKASARLRSTRLLLLSSTLVTPRDAARAGVDAVLAKSPAQSKLYNELVSALSRTNRTFKPSRPADEANGTPAGRVLVAEDNEINQLAARRVLQKLGYTVDIAHDGRSAIEMTVHTDYAAVLMDCQMPEIDGYAATAMIRRREGAGPRTPIIAMTAHTMHGDREKCLAAGMDDYLAKPIRLAELSHVLTRVVAGGDLEDALRAGDVNDCNRSFHANRIDQDAPVDESVVQEMLSDGGREAGLLDVFVSASQARLRELAEAVAAADGLAAARTAHSLKGSCATFGASRMARIAARLGGLEGDALLLEAESVLAELRSALVATEVAIGTLAAADLP